MKYWVVKIIIITFILAAGFGLVAEVFISNLSLVAAVFILIALVIVGIVFDIIGVAVATCDETPLIAMSAKKIEKARYALPLIKNADVVSNICNDVIGDVCGIVSGSAGATIALKIILSNPTVPELVITILVSSLIAAGTVGGKALGKKVAMNKNKEIVIFVGGIINFFKFKKK